MNRRYYVAVALYHVFIFSLSHQSDPPRPSGIEFYGIDKVAHFVVFGGLAALISFGLHRAPQPVSPWVLRYMPVLWTAGYGALDEFHQYFVPERSSSFFDLVADATGAVMGHALVLAYFRYRSGMALRESGET